MRTSGHWRASCTATTTATAGPKSRRTSRTTGPTRPSPPATERGHSDPAKPEQSAAGSGATNLLARPPFVCRRSAAAEIHPAEPPDIPHPALGDLLGGFLGRDG